MPSVEKRGALGYLRDFFCQSRDVLVSIVALAAGILWGGAMALHPELRACLQHGPLLIVALQVEKVRGPALGLVTPVLRFCHSA